MDCIKEAEDRRVSITSVKKQSKLSQLHFQAWQVAENLIEPWCNAFCRGGGERERVTYGLCLSLPGLMVLAPSAVKAGQAARQRLPAMIAGQKCISRKTRVL